MNYKSLGLLILLVTNGALSAVATVEKINAARVQEAHQVYANEAKWAPVARYAMLGAAGAIVAYALYKYNHPTITQPVTLEQLQQVHTEITKMHDATKQAIEIHSKKFLAQESKPDINEKPDSSTSKGFFTNAAQWTQSWISSGTGWAGSMIAINISMAAFGTLNGFASSKIMSYIPSSGSLSWYIVSRTEFNHDATELINALSLYEFYRNDLPDMAQAIVYDMEKILGYLRYFEANLANPTTQNKTASARYIKNIAQFTNDFVTAVNSKVAPNVIMDKFGILKTEIMLAAQFIEPRI